MLYCRSAEKTQFFEQTIENEHIYITSHYTTVMNAEYKIYQQIIVKLPSKT